MSTSYSESRTVLLGQQGLLCEAVRGRAARNVCTSKVLTAAPQFLIPVRGAFTWRTEGLERLVAANDMVFIAAGNVSSDRFHDDRPIDFLLLTANDSADPGPWQDHLACLFDNGRQSTVTASASAIQQAAAMLWSVRCCRPRDTDATYEATAMLVHTLASSLDSKLIERRRGESRLVERVKELIGAGSHAFTLVELARELKRSAAYLTDVFRRHEGVTIGRYQRRLRLSRSLVELRTADDLTSLALDLGFASHAHFSSAFKAEYGESPSAYRLRIRAASARR